MTNNNNIAYYDKESLKRAFVAQVVTARENKVFAKSPFEPTRASSKDFISWLAPSAKRCEAPKVVSQRTGIPEELLLLSIAAYQRINRSQFVAERFLAAVETGSDLSKCTNTVLHWLLIDSNESLLSYCKKKGSKSLVRKCAELFAAEDEGAQKAAQRLESDCRSRARSRKIRKKQFNANGERADRDLLRPEFIALWGAARSAAWKARKVHSSHWVLMVVDAWFAAARESFVAKNQDNTQLQAVDLRKHFETEIAPILAESLFEQLLSVIKDAAKISK